MKVPSRVPASGLVRSRQLSLGQTHGPGTGGSTQLSKQLHFSSWRPSTLLLIHRPLVAAHHLLRLVAFTAIYGSTVRREEKVDYTTREATKGKEISCM